MMTCADYKRWFSPYVDALLKAQERAQLETHIQGCAGCRAGLESLQQMLQALRSLEQPETPEILRGVHERLLRQPWWWRAAQRFVEPWPASLPLHGIALATVALLVVVVVSHPGVAPRAKLAQERLQLASAPSHQLVGGMHKGEAGRDELSYARIATYASGRSEADKSTTPLASRGEKQLLRQALNGVTQERSDVASKGVVPEPTLPLRMLDAEREDRVSSGLMEYARLAPALQTPSKEAELVKDQGVGVLPSGKTESPTEEILANAKIATEPAAPPAEVVQSRRLSMESDESYLENKAIVFSDAQTGDKGTPGSMGVPTLLQVQWRVNDLAVAEAQVTEWVRARQGFAVSTNDHHLSITLPTPEVPAFLEQFSEDMVLVGTVGVATALTEPTPGSAPPQTLRVAISLELVPIQPTEATSTSTTSSSAQTMQ